MLKSHFNIAKADDDSTTTETPSIKIKKTFKKPKLKTPSVATVMSEDLGRVLKKSEVSVRLSWLGRTGEGDGYAYLKATCTGMKLISIVAIVSFKHLMFVDFSNNELSTEKLEVLAKLPFLLYVQVDNNALNSAYLPKMKYLQVLIMNNNNIQSIADVYQPELCTLELGYNKIRHPYIENKMSNIKCFDFRYNLLTNISDIFAYTTLDSLYLAGNKIKNLIGIDALVNLRILHLRNNPIKKLDGFGPSMTKLNYLNLRNCKVGRLKQVKKLSVLPALESLVLKGTPYMGGPGKETQEPQEEEDDTDTRIEVLAALLNLKRLNKAQYTPEEREEGVELMKTWLEQDLEEEEEEEEEHLEEEHGPDGGEEAIADAEGDADSDAAT